MGSDSQLRVLLVAEGSGGHLVPALQVAGALASAGVHAKVWYAARPQTAPLAAALVQGLTTESVDVEPIPGALVRGAGRLWHSVQLWRHAERCVETFAPDVVVGFGGWVCAPVVLAAKRRRIACVLHEQNLVMGRTNRWLVRWVDRVAVSFTDTQALPKCTSSVITGLPVRQGIGAGSRVAAENKSRAQG